MMAGCIRLPTMRRRRHCCLPCRLLACSVKPNSVKKAGIFEAPICLQQLRYAGVFEAVKIRQQGA